MASTYKCIADPRVWATGSIASGAQKSNDVDVMGYLPVGVELSSGYEGAQSLWFTGSRNATNWFTLLTSSGATVGWASAVITSATTQYRAMAPEWEPALSGHRYLRLNTSANISTNVAFTLLLKPL